MSDQTPNAILQSQNGVLKKDFPRYSIFWTMWTAKFYQCHGYIFDSKWYKLGQGKLDKAYKF